MEQCVHRVDGSKQTILLFLKDGPSAAKAGVLYAVGPLLVRHGVTADCMGPALQIRLTSAGTLALKGGAGYLQFMFPFLKPTNRIFFLTIVLYQSQLLQRSNIFASPQSSQYISQEKGQEIFYVNLGGTLILLCERWVVTLWHLLFQNASSPPLSDTNSLYMTCSEVQAPCSFDQTPVW